MESYKKEIDELIIVLKSEIESEIVDNDTRKRSERLAYLSNKIVPENLFFIEENKMFYDQTRRFDNRVKRLKNLIRISGPLIILENEHRLLSESWERIKYKL